MGLEILPMMALLGGGGLVGGSIHSGISGVRAQKKGLRAQEEAQRQAQSAAAEQQRKSEMEQRAANQKEPNVSSLLGREASAAKRGPASTMLTGPSGVDPSTLKLGRRSMLGGGGT